MTPTVPQILALDFDGVICDGLIEYFQVAWRTYCKIWSSATDTPPDDLAPIFYRLRPVIETGWEMPVLIRALLLGIGEEKILTEWGSIAPEILQSHNLTASDVGTKLDRNRDEWIASDLDSWLSLHRFYPGVLEKIKSVLATPVQLYIITTKEGRFVQQLLQKAGIELPPAVIFGKEVKRPKYQILTELIQEYDLSLENVWFVEDRLKTLLLVQQKPNLDGVQLFLADWGYNTLSERQAAQNDPRIKLISLSQFAQDFCEW
jgi:phosphoglycolate phosphatase-like HAD superfamily hydrolase